MPNVVMHATIAGNQELLKQSIPFGLNDFLMTLLLLKGRKECKKVRGQTPL